MNLSQDELADKVYVSRQTISNWETGKSYPDIHSLLLLSTLFQVSLDQLVKEGDIETMKKEIRESEIQKLQHYGNIYTILLVLMIVSALPLSMWLGRYAILPWGAIVAVTFFYAFKVEKIKKANDVQTYKEIIAFTEGRLLDEPEQQQEIGKRPYQKAFLVIGSAIFGFVVCSVIAILIYIILY